MQSQSSGPGESREQNGDEDKVELRNTISGSVVRAHRHFVAPLVLLLSVLALLTVDGTVHCVEARVHDVIPKWRTERQPEHERVLIRQGGSVVGMTKYLVGSKAMLMVIRVSLKFEEHARAVLIPGVHAVDFFVGFGLLTFKVFVARKVADFASLKAVVLKVSDGFNVYHTCHVVPQLEVETAYPKHMVNNREHAHVADEVVE